LRHFDRYEQHVKGDSNHNGRSQVLQKPAPVALLVS